MSSISLLTCMFNCPEGGVLTPPLLLDLCQEAGFENAQVRGLVPGLTKVLVARSP